VAFFAKNTYSSLTHELTSWHFISWLLIEVKYIETLFKQYILKTIRFIIKGKLCCSSFLWPCILLLATLENLYLTRPKVNFPTLLVAKYKASESYYNIIFRIYLDRLWCIFEHSMPNFLYHFSKFFINKKSLCSLQYSKYILFNVSISSDSQFHEKAMAILLIPGESHNFIVSL
jgi:hypothetical protein